MADSASIVPGRVGIVGLGLIGGSYAKAFKANDQEVYVSNRSRSNLELALIETAAGELTDEILPSCELIILCTFPDACIAWIEAHKELISDGAVVLDACGTKTKVCKECFAIAEKHGWYFFGTHPMAGSENAGFAYSRADMFKGAAVVFCPPELEDIERARLIERVKELLAPCEFGVFTLATPENHDRMIAYTSQLPHVIANAYIKSPTNLERFGFSGGSWRDLTRIAKCNVDMWCELFIQNKEHLTAELDMLISELGIYKDAIAASDAEGLHALLEEGDRLKKESDAQ